jgi:hypothetical protein
VFLGDNLVFSICTHDPDTGVLTDADSAPTYRVYEDETATAILTGELTKLDDGNTTGFYTELIACTAGNGFEAGKTYTVYIEATVDSDTGGIAYAFKCEAPQATAAAVATIDTLLDNMAPVIIGTSSGSPDGTEVFVYGGVTVTSTVDDDGNRATVVIA